MTSREIRKRKRKAWRKKNTTPGPKESLSPKQKEEIRGSTETYAVLAKKYKVGPTLIGRVKVGEGSTEATIRCATVELVGLLPSSLSASQRAAAVRFVSCSSDVGVGRGGKKKRVRWACNPHNWPSADADGKSVGYYGGIIDWAAPVGHPEAPTVDHVENDGPDDPENWVWSSYRFNTKVKGTGTAREHLQVAVRMLSHFGAPLWVTAPIKMLVKLLTKGETHDTWQEYQPREDPRTPAAVGAHLPG